LAAVPANAQLANANIRSDFMVARLLSDYTPITGSPSNSISVLVRIAMA
jgi:hypothetical protein